MFGQYRCTCRCVYISLSLSLSLSLSELVACVMSEELCQSGCVCDHQHFPIRLAHIGFFSFVCDSGLCLLGICHLLPLSVLQQFISNRQFPEITGEDNLTVFSYSGRMKPPEWRQQRRRAILQQF